MCQDTDAPALDALNVISVQSSELQDDAIETVATASVTGEKEEGEEEDRGLGQDLEDEDFDEGISDISTHDTIINPSSSNSR